MKKKMFSEFEKNLAASCMDAMWSFCMPTVSIPADTGTVISVEECTDTAEEGEEEYLSRGRKLLTLAKSLMPKHREYTPLSSKIAKAEFPKDGTFLDILSPMAKIIRKEIRALGDGMVMNSEAVAELEAMMPNFKWFFGTFEEVFTPEVFEAGGPSMELLGKYQNGLSPWALSRKKRQDPNERTLFLYCPQVFPDYLLCGMQMGTSKYRNAYFVHERYLKPVDLSLAISYMIMLHTVHESIVESSFKETVAYKKATWCAGKCFSLHGKLNLPYSVYEKAYEEEGGEPCVKLTGRTIILATYGDEEVYGLFAEYLVRQGNDVVILNYRKRLVLPEHPLWVFFRNFYQRA